MSRYEIAFSGQLVPGAQPELVKANMAKLFQADEQRLALLFSGRRIVIKGNLDAAGAEKYRSTLERAGALVEVACVEEEIEEIELAPPQIMSLVHLSRHANAHSVLAEAASRKPPVVQPEPFDQDGIRTICYPGDPRHPIAEPAFPGPSRVLFKDKRFVPELGVAALVD